MIFTKASHKVVELLEEAGFEAVFVGGCVRDHILGTTPKDIDISTSALPSEVSEVFRKVIPTGIKHGTVTVLLEGEDIEVTTFRTDQDHDGRHAEVKFGATLEEDLARRDFRINSIAMRGDGTLVDPFGGALDIARKLVCATGDPRERFQEDRLRVMRGIRFASRLGFDIEPETRKAMEEFCEL